MKSNEEYKRNCPSCGKELTYKSKYVCKYAERDKKTCLSCSMKRTTGGVNNPRYVDISGKTFNYLTAIEPVGTKQSNSGSTGFYWKFKCVCGNIVEKHASSVKRGELKSCGCKAFNDKVGNKHGLWKGYGEISASHFLGIKNGAKIRRGKSIDFDLTIEYVWDLFLSQNRKCMLSGMEIRFGNYRKNGIKPTASLDRIDSSKGYVEGNVQWVHKDINRIKQDFSVDRFIELCKYVADNND